MIRPVYWKDGAIQLIDQTLLPGRFEEIRIETLEALWEAIRALRVRGAPAIGIAAAYGVALAARKAGNGGGLIGVIELPVHDRRLCCESEQVAPGHGTAADHADDGA